MVEEVINYNQYGLEIMNSEIEGIEFNSRMLQTKLYDLSKLSINDKLSVWEDTLYIDSSPKFIQWTWRRITRQGHICLVDYFDNYLNKYIDLLNTIMDLEKILNKNTYNYFTINMLLISNKKFIQKIRPGLKIVSLSYNSSYTRLSELLLITEDRFVKYINLTNDIITSNNTINNPTMYNMIYTSRLMDAVYNV